MVQNETLLGRVGDTSIFSIVVPSQELQGIMVEFLRIATDELGVSLPTLLANLSWMQAVSAVAHQQAHGTDTERSLIESMSDHAMTLFDLISENTK